MTWLEFKTEVGGFLTVDEQRKALDIFKEKAIRSAVVKLQDYVPFYRFRDERDFSRANGDVFDDNSACYVVLPELLTGSQIEEAYVVATSTTCIPAMAKCVAHPWVNRRSMLIGGLDTTTNRMSISPDRRIYLYPSLPTTSTFKIVYSAIRNSFNDSETVTWGAEAVECVSAYVKALITREVDKDLGLYSSYMATFQKERQELYRRNHERDGLIRTNG
jgi:hypothetical protein